MFFQDRVSCRRGNTANGPIDKSPIGHVQKDIVVVIEAGHNRMEYQGMVGAVGQMRPAVCPCCEKAETFHGHGWVLRVFEDVWVHRLRCSSCGRTVWLLPSFMTVHRWYGLAVIEQVLEVLVGEAGASRYERDEQVEALGPSVRTGRRWAASLGVQVGAWLAAMLTVLAKYAPQVGLFERPSLATPAQQLFELGPYFVDWLADPIGPPISIFARAGRDDWIMRLWAWGHARGLQRLV